MDIGATSQFDDIRMDMTVLRAMPCEKHADYGVPWNADGSKACGECLTGEEALIAGLNPETEERHVRWTRKEGRWQRLNPLSRSA